MSRPMQCTKHCGKMPTFHGLLSTMDHAALVLLLATRQSTDKVVRQHSAPKDSPGPPTRMAKPDDTPRVPSPIHKRQTDDDINHRPLYSVGNSCPSRDFPPSLAHLRVPSRHVMTPPTSTTSAENNVTAATSTKCGHGPLQNRRRMLDHPRLQSISTIAPSPNR